MYHKKTSIIYFGTMDNAEFFIPGEAEAFHEQYCEGFIRKK